VPGAHGLGSLHERPVLDRQYLGAYDARTPGDAEYPHCNDHGEDDVDALDSFQDAHEGDEDDEVGHGLPRIDNALDDLVDPAAEVAADDSESGRSAGTDGDGSEPDLDGDVGASDEPREDVPPERVGAQEVGRRRTLEAVTKGLPVGRVRFDHAAGQGQEDHGEHKEKPEEAEGLAPGKVDNGVDGPNG